MKAVSSKSPENPFTNLDRYRNKQNFNDLAGTKKVLTLVPVKRPNRQDFIRVRPGEDWRLDAPILEILAVRAVYLLDPEIAGQIGYELKFVILFTTITRQGNLGLWPIRLPDELGRHNPWHKSALDAAQIAEVKWIRLIPNMRLGGYEVFCPERPMPDPEWPEYSFNEIVETAFKDFYIDSLDHPILKKLRGAE
jgi:hypothetical protein